MIFLAVLLVAYTATRRLPGTHRTSPDRWRQALAAAMVIAGVSHLLDPTPFIQHLPMWVPARGTLVTVSGLVEIGLGLALLAPQVDRARVGLALAAFLVAVFPANIYVAVAGIDVDGQPGGIYPWVRLGFQPAFVWLAVWSTHPHQVAAMDPPAHPQLPTDGSERTGPHDVASDRTRPRPSMHDTEPRHHGTGTSQ